ncbi:MAG: FapA family protein [Humidesulfovibrio sp.]|uniref:FapA family protein n=1 Tax=Humidesulfovibrio sp. TaxID=2910988 RepID=UPI0027F9C501|nr:FapA family protein [Humidesulfovibrio sp.]MDQ7835534.1 FapA family protein [Humidesulfovibrio sp.]
MASESFLDKLHLRTGDKPAEADADATLRFGGSPDRMKVGVSRYVPAKGAGQPLSVELLRKALRDTGITAPLDVEHAEEVVRLLLSGKDASHIVIARGERPRNAQDAWIELSGAPGLPTFPGQVIGRLHEAVPAKRGLDVAGNVVPPPDPRPPRVLAVSSGMTKDREGMLIAQLAGVVRVTEDRIELSPLVRLSPDKLEATASLYARDAQGRTVTPEAMVQALAGQGVNFGILMDALTDGLAQAQKAYAPVQDVVVARGQAPVHGKDARLELTCGERACAEPPDEHARIDYRHRSLFQVVEQGQDIGRLHQPTKGVPGRDVTGAVVPARDGAALRIQTGKNVEALENGALFRAKIPGVVLAGKGSLDVSELLSIPGDVDYGTGNIELKQGSLCVGGTVRTGFTVEVPGQVLVEGMVESARVIAGGDVIVRGGIFMSGEEAAYVEAGGNVSAAFTHNAMVQAGGDVTIALSMVGSKTNKGSRVTAGGFLRVSDPKGRIMGGTVVSARGVEVFDAGNERGMVTTLALSHETPEISALIKELRELKALKDRAMFVVGEGDGATALSRLRAERRAEAEDLLARRDGIESRIKQIQRRLAELAQEHLERVSSARIIVHGTAYPGVGIKMGGRSLYVDRPLTNCVFSWDVQNKEIVTTTL